MNTRQQFQLKTNIIKELGFKLDTQAMILDFGCGAGELVTEGRKNGYKVLGCDLKFKQSFNVPSMQQKGIIRLISKNPYRIPFDDNIFDFVFSNQVLEHVQDYSSALSEIKRVLKPRGMSLHIFSARYNPIEPHVYVPLASIIQKHWWLLIWAYLGVRNQYQKGLSSRETASHNYDYLHNNTNYLTKKQIKKQLSNHFNNVIFCENIFLKHSRRGRFLYHISKVFPFIPLLYSDFRTRVIFFTRE